jgi:DNA-binding Lrp family transcriptional regulator
MRDKTVPAMKIVDQIIAFALPNTETGSEDEVLQHLKEVEEVKEAHILYGVYDIMAKIQAESMDELKNRDTFRV